MSDNEPGHHPLSEFATPVDSGLDEEAAEVGVAPFDARTAAEIRMRLREIDAAQQRAEARSRDAYVT